MKKMLNYISIYISGITISTAFILLSNDIFYDSVIKKLFIEKTFSKQTWELIKPREIYGNNAKEAFLNPNYSLINDNPNQTTIDYNEYLFRKKYEEASDDEIEKIKRDIANKKI
jgi:hypothetical protein